MSKYDVLSEGGNVESLDVEGGGNMADIVGSNYVVFAWGVVIVLLLVIIFWNVKGESMEAVPVPVETRLGHGYVESPLPVGGLSGPGVRFNVLTSTNQRPYATGYNELRTL